MTYLTERPVDVAALHRQVVAPDRGAICTFLGLVRNVHENRPVVALDYQAYGPMAETACGAIVAEAEGRWPCRVALLHRTGRLEIGDVAVAIVVAAAHRAESFEACRWIIEDLKRRVPIWKREFYADGTEAWVDPTAPGGTTPAGQSG